MSLPLPPQGRDRDGEPAAQDDEESREELESFCAAVLVDEIPFEEWQALHTSLDVTLPLFLTAEEALHGTVKEIRWSRALPQVATAPAPSPDTPTRPPRERRSRKIAIKPQTAHGTRILIPGEGDQAPARTGHLIVTVLIKATAHE